MAKENGSDSTETSEEVERDFKLTALVTQLSEFATKISVVKNQCKRQERRAQEVVQRIANRFDGLDSDHRLDSQEIDDPIENGGASHHSGYRRVDRRVRLTLPNGCELDGGSNSPKRRGEELPPGDKGKRKKHIARKAVATEIQANFLEPEDKQPLINRRDELRARSQSTPTNIPSAATPSTTDSVPAQKPPVAPALPIVPPPRLLNRLKEGAGQLISQEMAMRPKQKLTSLPFPVLITELCQHAGVPRDTTREIEVTPSSYTDIRRIEVPGASSSSQHARITQSMILKMGQLAYSADVRATQLDRSIPGMIDSKILATLNPIRGSGGDNEDAPETSGIPPATTEYVQRGGTTYEESNVKTDEERIAVHEEEMMES
uniref:Polyprotein protein n=1 Tax=Solanum tuberosum TaxID=4113 RepID=M1DPL3_SOLTU